MRVETIRRNGETILLLYPLTLVARVMMEIEGVNRRSAARAAKKV